jgi:hypothetical protein
MTRIKIAIVGMGKIARDQHVPSLAASEAFELVADPHGAKTLVELDFLQTGQQTWDIVVETDAGRLSLSMGGTLMMVDNQPVTTVQGAEYANLYAHFAIE